ncbi:MAG: efflux RND transporter periplasmic adaptor subunit [Betaproteobacteria bacterium]|nr:efflux RND transporter periplasmic adaptor subunit [Betaproteobacteria bacterium]
MLTIPRRKLALGLLSLALTACGDGADKQAGAMGGGPPPPEVDVVTAAAGSVTLTQDLPGRLQAVRTAQVRARVEGIVEKRLFEEGSDVKAGTPLFQIDDRNYRASASAAQADADIARLTVERYRTLLAVKAVSQQEFDLALAKQKQAEAALSRAQIDLENTRVPAPISGHIGRALVTEGALVGKSEPTQMATIEQIDPIYANFTQSNTDLLRLRQGMKAGKLKRAEQGRVELVQEDGSLYPLPGKLLFTDLAVDPSTGSVSLRAEFPNPKHELLPGQFVGIRYPQAQASNVIKLPQRAIQAGPQGQYVLTVDAQDKVVPLPVKTAGMDGGDWMIAEGLKGDEKVIVNGLQKVRPGSVVKPKPWVPASAQPEKNQ